MKLKINFTNFARAAFSAVLCCAIFTASGFAAGSLSSNGFSRFWQPELNRARQATARYHNIKHALADGYVDINVFIPKMGHHYLKPELLDAHFDPAQPELLVYADFGNGELRLVAVEYAVPLALSETPPEGFAGNEDHWHRNETFGLWTLHAWIWYPNPNGVFADFNPRVP